MSCALQQEHSLVDHFLDQALLQIHICLSSQKSDQMYLLKSKGLCAHVEVRVSGTLQCGALHFNRKYLGSGRDSRQMDVDRKDGFDVCR